MYRMIYASLPRTAPHAEILDIVRASERNNTRTNCSGVLFFSSSQYLQLIEGPEEGVEDLMARIRADPRHSIQWERGEQVPRRSLALTLPMGFLTPGELGVAQAAALRRPHPFPEEALAGHLICAAACKYPSAALPA